MKLSESECLWRSELKVVTDEATRMNASIRANKISAQGNSNGYAGPNMRMGTQHRSRNPVLLRGQVEETGLEHHAPV